MCESSAVLNVFVPDDFLNKGAETFSRGRMFERNHSTYGQLHKNHRRRLDVLLNLLIITIYCLLCF